ncbi:hypothetical protein CDL15_Pgr022467 [Punica granatum]|uniref:Uncharacterized protein n=1 Tax=Punica granatum TaxID=22663 RepID=A0A218XRR3_PUNGR|nr:hypothetical protein CDL15_Pgr022467 [Punica granatum]
MKLKVKHKCVAEYLVQRDYQVEDVMKLLDIESSEVRFVGIHGMGGIGKTTLAKLVFNELLGRFDGCSFLADVRESSRQHKGIELLQKQLLGDLGLPSGEIGDVDDGIITMRKRLPNKKVLILRDLGRTIVTDKSFKNIVKRSRLWKHEDALEVLQQDEDKRKIEMLRVRSYDNSYGYFEDAGYEYIFTQKELSSLRNLRYLECSGANFSGHLEHRLQKLMWLSWRRCPEKFMGTDLCLRKLVILDLSCSSISETWDGWSQIGTRNSLKVLDLHYCDCLTKMPDLSKYSTLERLILRQCTNLVEIDTSIGTLRGLKELDLEFCSSLEGLPEELFCPELIDMDDAELPQTTERPMKLEVLNLGHCGGLKKLPDSLGNLRSLAELNLSYTRITELPDTIGNLKKLARLDLSWTKITELPQRIGRLVKLEVLNLENCGWLKKLPNSLGNLRSLTELNLHGTGITELPDTIENLKELVRLDLYDTGITELPQGIERLVKLEGLCLCLCQGLKKLPDSLGNLRSLANLNLAWTGITELPDTIGNLKKLASLNLPVTGITTLPQSLERLVKLEYLSLHGCRGLKKFPDSLGNLRSLTKLYLAGTRFTEIPDAIGNLEKLVWLNIQQLGITELPQGIGRLEKLEDLDLYGCKELKKLPDSLGNLRSLVELELSDSGIIELPDSIGNLKKLRVIRMKRVKIKELPSSIGMLKRLEVLDAGGCQSLAEIPSTIEGLTCLRVLNLEDTCVCRLPPKLPSSLTELRVSSTSLQRVPKFSELQNLVELYLSDMDYDFYDTSGQIRPSKLRGIAKQRRLADLTLRMNITSISKKFSSHSQLQKLDLKCAHLQSCPPLPSSLSELTLYLLEERTKLPRLSNLKSLSLLVFRECSMEDDTVGNLGIAELGSLSSIRFRSCKLRNLDGFRLPESLCELQIESCCFLNTVSGLSHLQKLIHLIVSGTTELVEIRELGELESLQTLSIARCDRLKRLENLSKLKRLEKIEIWNCRKFKGIDDISDLKSLEILRIGDCDCEDVSVIHRVNFGK